jgi:hypothetical protein
VLGLGPVDGPYQRRQPVQYGLRVEPGGAVGEPGDGVDVEDNAVNVLQVPYQRGVDVGLLGQLQFVVVLAGTDGEGNRREHHRRGDALGLAANGRRPYHRACRKVSGVDAAIVGELKNLGPDVPGGAGRHHVLLAVPDEGGEPGPAPRHQLGQAGRVGVGQVNGAFRRLGEAQHCVRPGDGFKPGQPFTELLRAFRVALTN